MKKLPVSASLHFLRPTSRTVARAAVLIASFALSAALVWALFDRALTMDPDRSPLTIGHDLADELRVWRRGLLRDGSKSRVAFLGDSVLLGLPGERTVPDATSEALWQRGARGRRVAVHPLGWPGWGIAAQYFLADEIIRARPDRIMLELNLRAFGPAAPADVSSPELAGFIGTNRLWEAAWLPLSYAGLTLDKLLFYRLLVTTDMDASWADLRRRQANVFRLRDPVETALDAALGSSSTRERRRVEAFARFERMLVPEKNREQPALVKQALGTVLGGIPATHSRLRVLKATLDHYRRADIPIVVWVAPVNLDHLRSLGFSLDGLERSVATIRALVESTGAGFVDFHALLPDALFRDGGDHVTPDGDASGAAALGEALARVILWSEPGDTPGIRDAMANEPPRAVQ